VNLAAPYAPTPPAQRPRHRGGVVWPLVLIFIGGVFLLQNAGYLPANFWMNLWKLWPLVLVLAGIELLLSHRIPWLVLAGLGAVVLVFGAFAVGSRSPEAAPAPTNTSVVETDLGGATAAAITVRFGAGQLLLGPLEQPNPSQLAAMRYDGPKDTAPTPRYTTSSGGVGQLEYQMGGRGGFPWAGSPYMELSLAPNVPISSLNVQTGAANARVDLSTLHVSNADFSIGAATAWIRFPEAAGNTSAHISGGASTITLEIPQGVAAQIRTHGGLNTVTIDQTRFPHTTDEDLYRSSDYDTATNKLDLNIETGITTLQVN
jgi:hypothetical protein